MASQASIRPDESATDFTVRLANGRSAHVRAIRMNDVQRDRAFLERLSPDMRACRFLGLVSDSNEEAARELTSIDGAHEVVLAAFSRIGGREVEIGVARYLASNDCAHCDCAVAVDPAWQKLGVGRALMRSLIDIARSHGIRRMYAVDAARCGSAHSLAERLGFRARPDPEDPAITTFELVLQ